jgi:ABC-type sugar transport system substrate-binding protein
MTESRLNGCLIGAFTQRKLPDLILKPPGPESLPDILASAVARGVAVMAI